MESGLGSIPMFVRTDFKLSLVSISPSVCGAACLPPACTTAAPIPFSNPGLISIPLGMLLAVAGTLTSKETNREKYAELEVRSLTGAGAH